MSKLSQSEIKALLDRALMLDKKYNSTLSKWGLTTKLRRLHYFTQLAAESRFKLVRESGYYKDIKTARAIFYTPFKGKSDSFVASYLKNSIKMLSYTYANIMGNGSEQSGGGYFFRGGGYLQTTHKKNYHLLEVETGIPFTKNPDLILQEPNAIISACFFFKKNNLFRYTDVDDLDGVSDLVNKGRKTEKVGDSNGWEHRKQIYDAFKPHFL